MKSHIEWIENQGRSKPYRNGGMDKESIDRGQGCEGIGWINHQDRGNGLVDAHLEIVMTEVILDGDLVSSRSIEYGIGEMDFMRLIIVISASEFNQLDFYRSSKWIAKKDWMNEIHREKCYIINIGTTYGWN